MSLKKILMVTLITGLAVILVNCGHKMGPWEQGWVDDNTYQIVTAGAYPEEYADLPKPVRQEAALKAAELSAKEKFLSFLKGSIVKATTGKSLEQVTDPATGQLKPEYRLELAQLEKVEGMIKGVYLHGNPEFDENGNVIRAAFRIHGKNLRKLAEAGFR